MSAANGPPRLAGECGGDIVWQAVEPCTGLARAGPENKVWKTGQAGTGPGRPRAGQGLVVNFTENHIQIKPNINLKWPLFDTLE